MKRILFVIIGSIAVLLLSAQNQMANIKLDCIGKKCPMPVLIAKKELQKMSSGQVLELIVDDKGAIKDIPALLKKTGDKLLETKEENSNIIFQIKILNTNL